MPSFAISQFIILLEPLWVSADFLLLSTGPSTGPNLDGTLYPSYKKDFTRGPLTRGPRASSCYRMIIEHLLNIYKMINYRKILGPTARDATNPFLSENLKPIDRISECQQHGLANKYYSCWSASSSTAITLPVCIENVSSFFPRKL